MSYWDSEFQGISQDRLQFDSLLSAHAFTVTVYNVTGEIRKQLEIDKLGLLFHSQEIKHFLEGSLFFED